MPEIPNRTRGWNGLGNVGKVKSYLCPYCSNKVATDLGWDGGDGVTYIYVCPLCVHPTYFTEQGDQIPAPRPGAHVANVPPNVSAAYRESQDAAAAGAPTASVLLARKLLMNIAVDKGADAGKSFAEYVQYLADKGYVPPDGGPWVDHIRQKGNEATHEIPHMTNADATELITFIEMLLRFIYDLPARAPQPPT